MINEHNQIVCDKKKVILDDGKTIYNGYIEVKGGEVFEHTSDDPNNNIFNKPGILKYRKEFEQVENIGKVLTKGKNKVKDGHYLNKRLINML